MKANDKDTKAFSLVDGKFCLSKLWEVELWFWLIVLSASVFAGMLGWF